MDRAADHHVGGADPDETGTEGEGMAQRLARRAIVGELVGPPRPQVPDARGEPRVVAHCGKDFDLRQPFGAQAVGRRAHARGVALGEHDAPERATRPPVDAGGEAHPPSFLRSAAWTAGWTSPETSPPKRATSRTRLELR